MTVPATRILVVEDEPQIRRFVCETLNGAGYQSDSAETARTGLDYVAKGGLHLVILDLGLPDTSGLSFITDLRQWSTLPVLVLSARTEEQDKISALDAGADDYLTKPFGVGELLARVRVLLRRHGQVKEDGAVHKFGTIEVDLVKHEVKRNSQAVHLSQLEFRLLAVLVTNAGKVMTHRHLMKEVWASGNPDQEHYVRIYVRRLRQKLEDDPTRPAHLLTETGIGYRFQP